MNYWRKIHQIQLKINSLVGQARKDYCKSLLKINPKIFEELKSNPYYIINGKIGGLYPHQDFDAYFQDYDSIFFLGGRGCGKTNAACQYVKIWVDSYANPGNEIIYVGPTASHFELIKKDPAGVINSFPAHRRPIPYGKYGLKFWNGSYLAFISAEAYDRARSHNSSLVIFDELCIYDPNQLEDLRATVKMANRVDCKIPVKELIISTPKPIRAVGELIQNPKIKVITATTADNKHLSQSAVAALYDQYVGSSLADQELSGKFVFSDNTYLFKQKDIHFDVLANYPKQASGVCVAIDPAVSNNKQSDETGIIVGKQVVVNNKNGLFVLEDLSGIHSPGDIKNILNSLRTKYGKIYVTVEVNQGGMWVQNYLKEDVGLKSVAIETVRAKVGKYSRAELIAPYVEQGRIIFNKEFKFEKLLKQVLNFSKTGTMANDDRVDALVYLGFSIFNLDQTVGNLTTPKNTDW